MLKPLAKSAIKAGLATYGQARVSLAEFVETTGDRIAEARAETDQYQAGAEGANGLALVTWKTADGVQNADLSPRPAKGVRP